MGTCTGSLGPRRSILEVGSASLSAPTTLTTSEMRMPRKDFMARTLNVFTLYHCISAPELEGTRSFEGRGGVHLHKPMNRHLAEGYSSLLRFGARHLFVQPCIEVRYDPQGSMKAGKKTNQVIQTFKD